jgi:glycosyltransferase involved in cell wall biosynthesis
VIGRPHRGNMPSMKILFIHQNFPGQFKHLAPALAKAGHQVVAMSMKKDTPTQWQGVRIVPYRAARGSTPNVHPWLVDFETKLIRGEACFRALTLLQEDGFNPDLIIAHPGWGESLFVKEVWPVARLLTYCEFYYNPDAGDVGFDDEFSIKQPDDACRLQIKNLGNKLMFEQADAGLSPTQWQASTFPEPFRSRIKVIHDGIDTDLLAPNAEAKLTLKTRDGEAINLKDDSELITFVNRNLEPYRGYHIFMRALPELLKRRPNARVVLVGGDGSSYGGAPKEGGSWKQRYIDEVRSQISDADWARVHFVGTLKYDHFINLLQLSSVHVYWTYPFVLSWSLLEAMSVGCAIVASNTQPLHEAIKTGETGRLVDFFDQQGLVDNVCQLLDDPVERQRLGANAREFARANYDLRSRCLPDQLTLIETLLNRQPESDISLSRNAV